MASTKLGYGQLARSPHIIKPIIQTRPTLQRASLESRGFLKQRQPLLPRHFSSTSHRCEQQQHRKESFSSRLRRALNNTKIKWYPIPVGLGVGFLGIFQFYRVQQREARRYEEEREEYEREREHYNSNGSTNGGRPPKRQRTKPEGPWSIKIMYTLPLKAMSRLWGKFNELTIPYYLRVPGFKLYSAIFGVNLSEVAEPDLHTYPNLASFFYRTLKPGVRPLDPNPNALLSPADGKIIQYGVIEHGEVEQVKGVTYRLDKLLGSQAPTIVRQTSDQSISSSPKPSPGRGREGDEERIKDDEEFAQVNGISYTLPNMFSGPQDSSMNTMPTDQSTTPRPASESEVRAELALSGQKTSRDNESWFSFLSDSSSDSPGPSALYYVVVYLAPGDYHRFHSPVSWVVSQRRHFAGELYSVSPYLQRTLPGLFTLNERVVLLGRWRYGFFSYTPVGATNVGSIVVNFDRELRTNSLTTDTAADRAAEEAQERGEPYSGFAEATYYGASPVLGGHALRRGEEMGGFQLGSTIVLVFEAPKGKLKALEDDEQSSSGQARTRPHWKWHVAKGEKVKVGQALGSVVE